MTNKPKGIIAVRGNSTNGYKRLVAFLQERGYKRSTQLESLSDDDHVIAIIIDPINKTAHETSTMIMACYVSCGIKVLGVEEYISGEMK